MKTNVFRTAAAAALCLVAAAAAAKDFSTTIDLAPAQPLARVPKKFPGFGYVCDPKVGGEETVLEYRHSGAWVLKTKVCDEKTLEFLVRNHISILLVLDGSREKINADLKRRLAEFSRKYPQLCRLERSTTEGSVTYVMDKSRLSIRLVPPYSEERLAAAREYAKQHGFQVLRTDKESA